MAQSTGGANAPASAGPLAASWWSAGPGRPAAPGNRRKSASADPTDAWMDSDGVEHFCWLRGPMAKRLAVLVSSRASWQPVVGNPLTPRSWRVASTGSNTSFTRRVPVAKTHPHASICWAVPRPPYPAIPPASEQLGVLFVPSPLLRGSESAVLLSLSLPLSPRQAELDTLGPPPEAHRSDPPKAIIYTIRPSHTRGGTPIITARPLQPAPPCRPTLLDIDNHTRSHDQTRDPPPETPEPAVVTV